MPCGRPPWIYWKVIRSFLQRRWRAAGEHRFAGKVDGPPGIVRTSQRKGRSILTCRSVTDAVPPTFATPPFTSARVSGETADGATASWAGPSGTGGRWARRVPPGGNPRNVTEKRPQRLVSSPCSHTVRESPQTRTHARTFESENPERHATRCRLAALTSSCLQQTQALRARGTVFCSQERINDG